MYSSNNFGSTRYLGGKILSYEAFKDHLLDFYNKIIFLYPDGVDSIGSNELAINFILVEYLISDS